MTRKKTRLTRNIIMSLLICYLFLINCCVAFAYSSVYLGSGVVSHPIYDINATVKGYVYYNSNTSTALNLYSLAQYVTNNGTYDIDELDFTASDGKELAYHNECIIYNSNPIITNETRRVEKYWASVVSNTTYAKNSYGSTPFAYTNIYAGNSDYNVGGWTTYWFSTYRESDFHS